MRCKDYQKYSVLCQDCDFPKKIKCSKEMKSEDTTANMDKMNTKELAYDCECSLNLSGQYHIWEIICNKCSGTKEEINLIDESFNNFNARKIIKDKYDFTESEKNILESEWY